MKRNNKNSWQEVVAYYENKYRNSRKTNEPHYYSYSTEAPATTTSSWQETVAYYQKQYHRPTVH